LTSSALRRIDPTLVELEFDVPAPDLERAREHAFRELSRGIRMPGFRPGKVPRKLYEATYGSAGIEERARDAVLNEAYGAILKEHDLEPVEHAHLEEVPGEGTSLRFRAQVAVRAEIVLGEYKGMTLVSPSTAVSEADVDRAIEELRRREATLVPVDRPVQLGDVATLDFAGAIDGEPFEGGTATNQPTEVLEGQFIPGFASGIVGMKAGETKAVEATFPPDYQAADLAGKAATFTVTVHDVKVPELPPVDDEFAGRFAQGGTATVDGLRADVRARLDRANKARARQAMTAEVLERLRSGHDVPLPAVMVEREVDATLEEAKRDAERAGITWANLLERTGKSEDELKAEYRPDAERRVKTGLLLEAIAKAENIVATEADLNRELSLLSAQYGRAAQDILERMRPNLPALVDRIVRSKTVEFLVDSAQRVEASRAPAT
jgi:trigger factor